VARARSQWLAAGAVFAAVFAIFVVLERFYHVLRFESISGTYIGIHKTQNPAFYVGGDWWRGVWTLLFSPHDSVFWIHPGILLLALMLIFFWRKTSMGIKALAFCLFMLLLVLVAFYAPYPWPGGASGWGSRYTTTPSIVLGLLGFGLLAHFWREFCTGFKAVSFGIVTYALVAQIGSLLYWSNLEQLQWESWGKKTFLVGQRWINTAALLGGTFGESSLMVPALSERIMRLNFMPFHVRAELGGPVGAAALALWLLLMAALVAWVVAIWRVASKRDLSGEKHDCP